MKQGRWPASIDVGMSLVEVLIAMALVALVAVGVAQMSALSIRAVQGARWQTSTTLLASEKLEQLRALVFRDDGPLAGRISDHATDLSVDPANGGGRGLASSPSNTLDANVDGYVDYLDPRGRWMGTGTTPPATAVFIRRWNVSPLPVSPDDGVVLLVLVTTVHRERQASPGVRERLADDALVATVKTRKAR